MFYHLVSSVFGSDMLNWLKISLSCGIKSCFIVRVGVPAGITATIQQESQVPALSEFVSFSWTIFCLSFVFWQWSVSEDVVLVLFVNTFVLAV